MEGERKDELAALREVTAVWGGVRGRTCSR